MTSFPTVGMAKDGPTTSSDAQVNLAHLFARTMRLYTLGDTASVSELEATELLQSLGFVLGINGLSEDEQIVVLDVPDIDALYERKLKELDKRVDATMELWREVCALMPPLRNVALRDTLASIGDFKRNYDVRFAAHEVPCDIDYPLAVPVDDSLQGVEYLQAWLVQAKAEACWLAQFEVDSCIKALEANCPDYRGLHINLCDVLRRARFGSLDTRV